MTIKKSSSTKIYPGSDSSTWPASGSMWRWTGFLFSPNVLGDDNHLHRVSVKEGDLVFLAKVIYCTKAEITCNFIFGEKVVIWAFPCSQWNRYFEAVSQ